MKTEDDQNGKSEKDYDRESQTGARIPTRSWCDAKWEPLDADRIGGMKDFLDHIRRDDQSANPTERAKLKDHVYARRMFAEWGGFYLEETAPAQEKYRGIPSSTVFRVYEQQEKRAERDEEVVLVLPSLLNGSDNEALDQAVYPSWRCTYVPYKE